MSKKSEDMVSTTVCLTRQQLNWLDQLAGEYRKNRSEVVRWLVTEDMKSAAILDGEGPLADKPQYMVPPENARRMIEAGLLYGCAINARLRELINEDDEP